MNRMIWMIGIFGAACCGLLAFIAGCGGNDDGTSPPKVYYKHFITTIRHDALLEGATHGFVFTNDHLGRIYDVQPWAISAGEEHVRPEVKIPPDGAKSEFWTGIIAVDPAGRVKIRSALWRNHAINVAQRWGMSPTLGETRFVFSDPPGHFGYIVAVPGAYEVGEELGATISLPQLFASTAAFVRLDREPDPSLGYWVTNVGVDVDVPVSFDQPEELRVRTATVDGGGFVSFRLAAGDFLIDVREDMAELPVELVYRHPETPRIYIHAAVAVAADASRNVIWEEYRDGVWPGGFNRIAGDFEFPTVSVDSVCVVTTEPVDVVLSSWHPTGVGLASWVVEQPWSEEAVGLPELPDEFTTLHPELTRADFDECVWFGVMTDMHAASGTWALSLSKRNPSLAGAKSLENTVAGEMPRSPRMMVKQSTTE